LVYNGLKFRAKARKGTLRPDMPWAWFKKPKKGPAGIKEYQKEKKMQPTGHAGLKKKRKTITIVSGRADFPGGTPATLKGDQKREKKTESNQKSVWGTS